MREKWRKAIVFTAAVSIVCSQSAISNVFAAGEDDVTMQQTDHTVSIEYLTLQPGERDDSVNLNWYAPEGTKNALVRMGDTTVEASVRALHAPTKVVEGKYTDTGRWYVRLRFRDFQRGRTMFIRFPMIMEIPGQNSILIPLQMMENSDLVLPVIHRLRKMEKQITADGTLLMGTIRPAGR